MLLKCCTQYVSKFGKLSNGHRTGKGHYSSQSQRQTVKGYLNYRTIALISHASKVMLKILQARLQQYVNRELPDVHTGYKGGRCGLVSHLLYNFPKFVVIHTVKGFSIVSEAEVDVFLELSCFFYHLKDVGNLVFGSSAFSESNLDIWKFLVHILLKPSLENFEHYFTSK